MSMRKLAACAAALMTASGAAAQDTARVAMLVIEGDPLEHPGELSLFGSEGVTLSEYVMALEDATLDSELNGVLVRLKDAALGATDVEELGRAMNLVRESGKPVHVYAERYGLTELLLASYADAAWLQQGGTVSLPGLYAEEMYLADTLEWAGMRADLVQVGDYKGAAEPLGRSEPSEAWEENISGLLDAMWGQYEQRIRRGRSLSEAKFQRAMEQAWSTGGERAAQLGLIDGEVDLPDLFETVGSLYGVEIEYAGDLLNGDDDQFGMMAMNPLMAFAELFAPPSRETLGPTLAVLYVDGAIVDGDSEPEGFFGGATAGARTLRNAMTDIAEDENIRGVVVRVDSPGGSAAASESIWKGLRDLAEEKAVWVSVGSMAASGGYYTAVGGSKIYVNPTSIVGSIGVVGGKIVMGGLLEDKIKINVVERARGPRASMLSSVSAWTDDQRGLVREEMTRIYDQFADRVKTGRPGLRFDQVDQGRLFVGRDAVRLGMADEVGGLSAALDDLASDLGLYEYDVLEYPAPKPLEEVLEDLLGGFVSAPGLPARGGGIGVLLLEAVRAAVGERRFDAMRDSLNAMSQLREGRVLLTSPRVLLFR